jgi:hypothetical protein
MGRLFGAAAMEAVMRGNFGKMISARGIAPACRLSMVPLSHAVDKLKKVDLDLYYDTARYSARLGVGDQMLSFATGPAIG